MNKNGFTLLELLTSLTLTSIVCILMFQVIFTLKDIYVDDAAKTEMLIKKSNIIEEMNSTFKSNPITSIRYCDNGDINCFKFNLEGDLSYELSLNRELKNIKFGDYTVKLSESAEIYDNLDICYYSETSASNSVYDTFIKIRIPIKDNVLEEKIDVNVIYQYLGSNFSNLIGTIVNGSPVIYIPQC